MIKVIWAADRNAAISDDEFYGWWRNVHGFKEFGTLQGVRRYVQHHTLGETRDGSLGLTPTRDGASIGWFDDFEQLRDTYQEMAGVAPGWSPSRFDPTMDIVVADEKPIVDGEVTPDMVKGIYIFRRLPQFSVEEFQRYWYEVHSEFWRKVPGVRRYVQNHALPEAYERSHDPARERGITHDGWSEVWFDDFDAFRRAIESPERAAAGDDGRKFLEYPMSSVIAREGVIVG